MANILFMCVANSARSQLAEGLARSILSARHRIESAGSQPSKVNPYAIRAMEEIGIDLSSHHSKRVEDLPKEFVDSLDYVITLCAEEVCPVIISKARKLAWPHPDPAGKPGMEADGPRGRQSDEERLQRFRDVREAIRLKLEAFAREIGD